VQPIDSTPPSPVPPRASGDRSGDSGQRAIRLARAAGREAGLDVSQARLLRERSSVHVELPRAKVVARVEAPGAAELAERQVRIARLLADRGAPVARLVRPELQPCRVEDGAVTLWRQLLPVADPDFAAVGRAVLALHDATRDSPLADLPRCEPVESLRRYLDGPSPWSGSPESEELRRQADALEGPWRAAAREDPLGQVIVHGDAHQDNAIMTEEGPVLLDLEDTGKGPASWDFATLKVGVQRYGLPAENYRDFAAGYGREPGDWEGHEVMCRLYELMVAAWAMLCSAVSPRMAAEASLRVATVLGQGDQRWTLL
jgi:aminoglycoside phosphotransferase (APT) family kinase protein